MSKMSEHQSDEYDKLFDALKSAEEDYCEAIRAAEIALETAERAFDTGKEKLGL